MNRPGLTAMFAHQSDAKKGGAEWAALAPSEGPKLAKAFIVGWKPKGASDMIKLRKGH